MMKQYCEPEKLDVPYFHHEFLQNVTMALPDPINHWKAHNEKTKAAFTRNKPTELTKAVRKKNPKFTDASLGLGVLLKAQLDISLIHLPICPPRK